MSDYDADVLSWSEEQAALLRRVAAGERLNEAAVDWPNIVEEIESVGRSELHSVESLLTRALSHLLKIEAWPDSPAVRGWRKEVRVLRRQARRRFTPSMRQLIDLAGIYADAFDLLPDLIDGREPQAVPPSCRFTLDQLLTSEDAG